MAKNSARASTAAAARSRAKQLEGVREKLEGLASETGGGKSLGAGPGDSKRVTLRLPEPPEGAKVWSGFPSTNRRINNSSRHHLITSSRHHLITRSAALNKIPRCLTPNPLYTDPHNAASER